MKNIYKTKSGNFRVQLFLNGRQRHLGTYPSVAIAERIRLNYLKQKYINKLEALK